MSSEFVSLNDIDTKELRKKLGFPISKGLKYFHTENGYWYENDIVDYKSTGIYQSDSHDLLITLDDGKRVCMHSDYLADMQKPSFVNENSRKTIEAKESVSNNDVEKVSSQNTLSNNKIGKRIEAKPKTYIVVDLETTGLNHYLDEIIEIGAIKYVNGTEIDRYSVLIKTSISVPSKIEKLTGITNDMIESEGVEKATAISKLYGFLGNDIVVGHNFTAFDSKFIDDAFQDVLKCHFSNDYIDTYFLAKRKLPHLERYRLKDLSEEYNIDYSKAHRAVEDCIINHFIYEYMVFGRVLNENVPSEYLLGEVNQIKIENDEKLIDVNKSCFIGWKERLNRALNDLIAEEKLPANSLCLMANVGRQNDVITSYSVCIYEPDLIEDRHSIERNSIVTRIIEGKLKSNPDILTIEPKNQNEKNELLIPDDATLYEPEKALAYIRIDQNSDNIIPYLISSVKNALVNYSPKASSFACCARFEECSDDMKCVHENQLYSKACEYRKNLEAGRIFYGKNKNT